MKLIDKDKVVAEIERRRDLHYKYYMKNGVGSIAEYKYDEDRDILSFLDTLEVKKVSTWHLQEKEDIYDAVKDWGLYKFVCIMKDGTIQRFNGCFDEDCEGHINVHINGINDDYDDVDDIVKWIEIT